MFRGWASVASNCMVFVRGRRRSVAVCRLCGWAVARLADHACVGIVSLNYPINQSEERELGWLLWESYEGNGYAVEAASAARKFAFEELGWAALVSYIATDNDRSIRLAERMGASKDHDATKRTEPKTVVYLHHPKKCGSQK